MADDYWNRQQPLLPSPAMLKRPRTDYAVNNQRSHKVIEFRSAQPDTKNRKSKSAVENNGVLSEKGNGFEFVQAQALWKSIQAFFTPKCTFAGTAALQLVSKIINPFEVNRWLCYSDSQYREVPRYLQRKESPHQKQKLDYSHLAAANTDHPENPHGLSLLYTESTVSHLHYYELEEEEGCDPEKVGVSRENRDRRNENLK
ncbi:hypothetical protein Csa_019044 [Cucumis sativus]|nr:hypothetical protein Csa_019044 [Cucumis sativus]